MRAMEESVEVRRMIGVGICADCIENTFFGILIYWELAIRLARMFASQNTNGI